MIDRGQGGKQVKVIVKKDKYQAVGMVGDINRQLPVIQLPFFPDGVELFFKNPDGVDLFLLGSHIINVKEKTQPASITNVKQP